MVRFAPLRVRFRRARIRHGFSGVLLRAALVFAALFLVVYFCAGVRCDTSSLAALTSSLGSLDELAGDVRSVFSHQNDVCDSVQSRFSQDDVAEVFAPSAPVFSECFAPLDGRVTSPYGYRLDPLGDTIKLHSGVDISAAKGTPVCAVSSGTVTATGYSSGAGYYVTVDHRNRFTTTYCHLSEIKVKKGDEVGALDVLALSGDTGNVTGPHLHLILKLDGTAVDPCAYLPILP